MTVLVASDLYTHKAPVGTRWTPKMWRTRDGKTNVFYAIIDGAAPEGFVKDERYDWKVDGTPSEAFFSPETREAWYSERRGVGELARKPHIIFAEQREQNIYEKLAAAADPASVLPQIRKRAPSERGGTLVQACRQEIDAAVAEYNHQKALREAERGREDNAARAETMRIIREICASYGQPNFVTRLP